MLVNGFAKNVKYTNLSQLVRAINNKTKRSQFKISDHTEVYEALLKPLAD